MGGNGVVVQSNASSLRQRAGMELPVGKHIVPDKPLSVNDELMWDNGTAFPEPCIDRIAHTIGKVSAAGYDRQGVADHANNLAIKIRNNLTNSIKALGVDILTGFGSVLDQPKVPPIITNFIKVS
ncbi:hypothetical protein Rs2_32954 [Raphanus sativus]|nr:hypothetical protein Rs2_32954 [Raphanus sativus]